MNYEIVLGPENKAVSSPFPFSRLAVDNIVEELGIHQPEYFMKVGRKIGPHVWDKLRVLKAALGIQNPYYEMGAGVFKRLLDNQTYLMSINRPHISDELVDSYLTDEDIPQDISRTKFYEMREAEIILRDPNVETLMTAMMMKGKPYSVLKGFIDAYGLYKRHYGVQALGAEWLW